MFGAVAFGLMTHNPVWPVVYSGPHTHIPPSPPLPIITEHTHMHTGYSDKHAWITVHTHQEIHRLMHAHTQDENMLLENKLNHMCTPTQAPTLTHIYTHLHAQTAVSNMLRRSENHFLSAATDFIHLVCIETGRKSTFTAHI